MNAAPERSDRATAADSPVRHVVHILEATTGGTRRHLRDVVTGLDRDRFRQTVIASPFRDPGFLDDVAEFRRQGVAVHLVAMRRSPSPFGDPLAAARIARLLRGLAPDVVHTHSSKAGVLGRAAARFTRVPWRVHTPHVFAYEMRVPAPAAAAAAALERLAARWTHRLVCVAEAEARAARRLGRSMPPLRIVHNGVDVPAEPPAPPLRTPSLRFALVGRLCAQKGQDTLARALLSDADLAKAHRFELVGIRPGDRLPPAVRSAAEWGLCHLLPPLEPVAVATYLRTVDVVVLPSRWEGLPYTLLEAMAAARCVVAANVGGVPEVVRDGANGWLVSGEAPAAWTTALRAVAADPDEARRRALAAHDTVLRDFTLDAMLRKLASVYEEGPPPRRPKETPTP